MSRLFRSVVLIVVALLTTAPLTAVAPSTSYRIIDLATLVGESLQDARAINDRGQIVAVVEPTIPPDEDDCQACLSPVVLLEKGTIVAHLWMAPWQAAGAKPLDINDRGQIAGFNRELSIQGVVWEHGTTIELGTLTGSDGESGAFGINNRGQVVGYSGIGGSYHAVLWEHGTIADLSTLTGSEGWSLASGINNRGQIVGYSGIGSSYHAVLWENGTITDLGTLSGPAGFSVANGINSRGQIVGSSWSGSYGYPGHAVLWENGTITDLGTLAGSEGRSLAVDINNRGQIVGYSGIGSCCHVHAVLWEHGTITDLGTLSGPGGVSVAYGINNRGQIVGVSLTDSGIQRGVLWEPVATH
jgi:probable HAF family extracellular repeat protein